MSDILKHNYYYHHPAMAKELVDAAVNDNKVAVFSKSYCPYCKMAKDTLTSAGLTDYYLLELDQRGNSRVGW